MFHFGGAHRFIEEKTLNVMWLCACVIRTCVNMTWWNNANFQGEDTNEQCIVAISHPLRLGELIKKEKNLCGTRISTTDIIVFFDTFRLAHKILSTRTPKHFSLHIRCAINFVDFQWANLHFVLILKISTEHWTIRCIFNDWLQFKITHFFCILPRKRYQPFWLSIQIWITPIPFKHSYNLRYTVVIDVPLKLRSMTYWLLLSCLWKCWSLS